jgi:hypothetical protein
MARPPLSRRLAIEDAFRAGLEEGFPLLRPAGPLLEDRIRRLLEELRDGSRGPLSMDPRRRRL